MKASVLLHSLEGYSINTGAIRNDIAPETVGLIRQINDVPTSRSSRPIFELLAGKQDWEATKELIKASYTSPLVTKTDPAILGLIAADLPRPHEVFAISLPIRGNVVPAVLLRAEAEAFDADPCALHATNIADLVIARFRSASVTAMLTLTRRAFRGVLNQATQSGGRLHALCATGTLFKPIVPAKRDWITACHWRDWQLRHQGFQARAIELAKLLDVNVETEEELDSWDAALRTCCSRKLKLLISDRSDT